MTFSNDPIQTPDVSRRVRIFLLVNGLLTLLCVGTEAVCYKLGMSVWYWKPWFIGIGFHDFNSYVPRFQLLHTARFFDFSLAWPFGYPAPCAFVYALFFSFGQKIGLMVFLATSVAIFAGAALIFRKALLRRGLPAKGSLAKVGLGVVCAFPLWFGFQRGNIEIVVWLFLALGVWAFTRRRGYSAAVCFGIAASLKLVPFVYLALLVPRRQYKQIACGLAVFAGMTLLGYAFIGPTIPMAYHGIQAGLGAFQVEFLTHVEIKGAGFDHTMVGFYRRIYGAPSAFPALLHWYTVTVALLGALAWLVRIRVMPFLNQLVALSVAALWLVPVSFEYTLVHLYFGIGCLLLAGGIAERRVTPLLMMLAALCAPVTEFIHRSWTYGGQLQCVVLAGVFGYALVRRLPSDFDEQASAGVAQAG